MFIIPDDVLSQLICSLCHQYLSVKPVKIYRSGKTKCGRCSQKEDGGILSIYEKIIENGLFPCINRYEGCPQLLTYSEVAAHESKCLTRRYTCPICSVEFTSLTFVQHYQKDHADTILEKPELLLTMEKEYENYWFYKENDFIFILYARCHLSESCFYVNVACLGSIERVGRIKQYVKCYYLGNARNPDELFIETKDRHCSLVDNKLDYFKLPFFMNTRSVKISFYLDKSAVNFSSWWKANDLIIAATNKSDSSIAFGGLHKKYHKLYLNEAFEKKYPDYYLSPCSTKLVKINVDMTFPRICEFCENILPVSLIHLYYYKDMYMCYNCLYMVDVSASSKFQNADSPIIQALSFYCRWNCGKYFSCQDVRLHEKNCIKNVEQNLSTLAAKYVNLYNYFISRLNIFSFKKYIFKNNEKIFVLTYDYVKFVLHSSYQNQVFRFWVTHDYPKDKCLIQFKIMDKTLSEPYFRNTEILLDNTDNKGVNNVLGFAVVLKEN